MIKQRNIPWIGAFIEALYNSLPLLSIINFLAILTILYAEIKPYLLEHLPWITIEVFMGAVLLLTIIVMLLIYRFVLPSLWTFRGKQLFGWDSEIKKILKRIEDDIQALKEQKEK